MKIDDLLEPAEELNNSENTGNDNVENSETVNETNENKSETDPTKNQDLEFLEEKKESAAELIIRKLEQNKLKKDESEENKNDDNLNHTEEVQENEKEVEIENIINFDEFHEHETEHEEFEPEEVDYSTLTNQELVDHLKILLEKSNIQKFKDKIEAIKVNFYKKHHAELEGKKKLFIESGGKEEEFVAETDPLEDEFKTLYSVYKEKRAELNINTEKEKNNNLALKYQIIEKIEQLTNGTESLNKTFHEFKELQKQWQELGPVPQSEVKKLWDSYHYQVEKFYDYVKINKDLRDLDLKKNLESKLELCERAETLLLESKIVSAFRDLQKLHAQWREIGPVPSDKKEELWERFKQATSKINKKHQDYFEFLKREQLNNLKAKTLLSEKVEEINSTPITTAKLWEENAKEVVELQGLWKLIGFAPKKENNKIYARFRKACDTFFDAKREFYSKNKEEEENNFQLKTDLCIQAESLKESTDWKKVTEIYIELQKKWKTIGSVPRKHKDEIWNRFRNACNTFFERKAQHFSSRDDEQEKNLELKRNLIEKVKNFKNSEDNHVDIKSLNEIQKEWTEIGHVPIKFKDELLSEFREAINKVFEKLELNENEKTNLKFISRIEGMKNTPQSFNKIKNERDKMIQKLEKLRNNIVLWENNIGFFARSKNAESMIKDFELKIQSAKQQVKDLENQLNMLDEML
ncbi:MAG: DUF349 domain-containing protein [Bacteroidales bacterium]